MGAGELIDSAIDTLSNVIGDSAPSDGSPMPSTSVEAGGRATVIACLRSLFQTALNTAYPDRDEKVVLALCKNGKNGDYQCNNAMGLFGKLKKSGNAPQSPKAVAEAIVAALPPNPLIGEITLAGAGFINIMLSRDWLSERVNCMLTDGLAAYAPRPSRTRVVVDFSSPNVAKEMHVGHLRSTILGDTICNTLTFCGCDVQRINHVGDWGTQFGMLIQYMATMRPEGLGTEGGSDEDVADLQVLYRAAKAKFDEDEDFKTKAREAVTTLQAGDPVYLKAWGRICQASRLEFQRIYDRLGVTLTERGESFYNPMLQDVVQELKDKGVAEVSDGATVVWIEGVKVPLIVQKSDGGYGYASTDMAAIKHRLQTEKAEWIIYVTDAGQASHFDLVFAGARRVGWLPPADDPAGPRIDHVGFGLVMGEDGKKFKTRSGDVVRLVELLDEAKQRCRESIMERRTEAGNPPGEEELEKAACAMGYGAVKYADLKNSRLTNYRFSYDRMLDTNGDTAVYLLYQHARICAIVRKGGVDIAQLRQTATIHLEEPAEMALGLYLARFPEALEDMMTDLMPNRITEYLYELCDAFSAFYTGCRVIGSEQQSSRLLLSEATAVTMRQCFDLLGITHLERI